VIRKALAYITRQGAQGLEVLVFEHWTARNPAHSCPEERLIPAKSWLMRSSRDREETGLVGCRVMRMLAQVEFYADWRDEWQMRHVFHLTAPDNSA
jgi:hypothetical protein